MPFQSNDFILFKLGQFNDRHNEVLMFEMILKSMFIRSVCIVYYVSQMSET